MNETKNIDKPKGNCVLPCVSVCCPFCGSENYEEYEELMYENGIDDSRYGGNDAQGEALVKCQIKKIKQLTDLIENIKGEIELAEEPKEYSEKTVLNSIKAMIEQTNDNIPLVVCLVR